MYAIGLRAAPVAGAEPSKITEIAVSTGLPFDISVADRAATLVARQWEPPITPAWTPVPTPVWTPAPTPSYTWEETHNDDKNTLAHGIIAAIVIGLFLGVGFVGCIFVSIYRKCCGRRLKVHDRKGKARDIESGSLTTANIEMLETDSITSAENNRPTQSCELLSLASEDGLRVARPPQQPTMVHYSRGRGMRPMA
ncbi:hypothetical protein FB567DRAFT_550141 [Paraphoma chrysanthemicola]|uniref:Uncharacterized protein n=1 Tax=Paraphoma chrysanthemicola TaxID=798071 RepID=A0A8K0VWS3_9PLEO|nr:hypothetical protein FB567DRAFT_550141 [Paraphoma chrysanthemicola]